MTETDGRPGADNHQGDADHRIADERITEHPELHDQCVWAYRHDCGRVVGCFAYHVAITSGHQVLDGRNRYAACELAGITPKFVTYDGDDPAGYALAVNIARRHLTKGQQAMVAARAMVICGRSQRGFAAESGIAQSRLAYAKSVLDYAPDLADSVVAGGMTLDRAWEQARERKRAAESSGALMTDLRRDAPDLADQVTEERLQLNEALAALRARQAEEQRERRGATELLCSHVVTIAEMDGAQTGGRYDPELVPPGREVTDSVIANAAPGQTL